MAKAGENANPEDRLLTVIRELEAIKLAIGEQCNQIEKLEAHNVELDDQLYTANHKLSDYEDGINADCRWLAKEVLDIVALNHHESNCTHDACKVDMRVAITCPIYLLSVVDDIADLLANYTPKDN